jgi:hypothetical protein
MNSWIEARIHLHQADIALGDELADRKAVAAIAHGDLGDEAKVAVDQLRSRFRVIMLPPALGEHILFLGRKDRELLDFGKIAIEPGFPARSGYRDRAFDLCHSIPSLPAPGRSF